MTMQPCCITLINWRWHTLNNYTLHTYKQKRTTTSQEAQWDARRVLDGERRPTEGYCGLGLGVESERNVTTGNMRASSDAPVSWSGGGPSGSCLRNLEREYPRIEATRMRQIDRKPRSQVGYILRKCQRHLYNSSIGFTTSSPGKLWKCVGTFKVILESLPFIIVSKYLVE